MPAGQSAPLGHLRSLAQTGLHNAPPCRISPAVSAETTTTYPPPREAPWAAGLRAARANIVPALILQGVMFGLLLAYWFYPPTTGLLNQLADLKARWGYGYAAVSAAIAGAVIPEILRVTLFQRGIVRRTNWNNLLFAIAFWGLMGTTVDAFYRLQAFWFGAEAAFPVVLKKVLVDQLIYTPFFASPVTAILYDWKNRGYGLHDLGGFFTPAYFRHAVLPTIVANWGVWVPVVSIVYSLPSLLQVPLFGLALSMWVILYTWMSERRTQV